MTHGEQPQEADDAVSAVICTYRRPELLRAALHSLVSQKPHRGLLEVIVVDNGPDDSTRRVVEASKQPGFSPRYVIEPIRGIAPARHRGWIEAKGEIVAYLDDDEIADENWIGCISDTFFGDPNVDLVGGPVRPLVEGKPPKWHSVVVGRRQGFSDDYMLDLGAEYRRLGRHEHVWNGNLAIRRCALELSGAYRERLGRTGRSLLGNEEIILQERFETLELSRFYQPAMVVYHRLPPERMTKLFVTRKAYWQGASDAIMWRYLENPQWGSRRRALSSHLDRGCRVALWMMGSESRSNEQRRLRWQTSAAYQLGYCRGILWPLVTSRREHPLK